MFKVRIVLVFLNRNLVLLDRDQLPSFYFLNNDLNICERVLATPNRYFNYPDIWLDFYMAEPRIKDGELELIYGALVAEDNLKGEWKDVARIKDKSIQEAIYNVSKMV